MAHELTLKHYWRSSCSWRVRWALALKGLSYRSEHVDLLRGEQHSAEHRRLHPQGVVPILLVDGVPLLRVVGDYRVARRMLSTAATAAVRSVGTRPGTAISVHG